MREKSNFTKRKTLIGEISAILVGVIILIASAMCDFNIFVLPDILILNIDDVDNLFFTLFTVQAGIAASTIAINSIITGLADKYIMGVSVSGFVSKICHPILNYKSLIITDLIITAINYFCLSYSLFNCCIAIFVLSIAITIILTSQMYIVFSGQNRIRQKIYDYIFCNYNKIILDDLSNELDAAIDIENWTVVKEDLVMIKDVFCSEIHLCKGTPSKLSNQLSSIIEVSFSKIALKRDPQKVNMALGMIYDIYTSANNSEQTFPLDIWDAISRDFLNSLYNFELNDLINEFKGFGLHTELYKNLKARKTNYNNDMLKYYFAWMYSVLSDEKSKLTAQEKRRILKDIYDLLNMSLFYRQFDKEDAEIDNILISEMCYINKFLIDENRSQDLQEIFFKNADYYMDRKQFQVVFLITTIYLYYLGYRESLLDDEFKERVLVVINSSKETITFSLNNVISFNDILKEYLPFIRKILFWWEYMEDGEAKSVIIDNVTDDFLIFRTLSEFYDEKTIFSIVDIVAPQSVFPLYSRYFSNNGTEKLKSLFSEYVSAFGYKLDKDTVDEKVSMLLDIFNSKYKAETIKEGLEHRITNEEINKLKIDVTQEINNIICNSLSAFSDKEFKEPNSSTLLQKTLFFRCRLSEFFFKQNGLEKHLKDSIKSAIIKLLIGTLSPHMTTQTLKYDQRIKQKTLMDMIEQQSVNADIVIGNRENFRGEDDPELLNKYCADMTRIKFDGGYNYFYLLESGAIEFILENIQVEISDLAQAEIEKECNKTSDGKLEYNITNDLNVPFELSELLEYVTNTQKNLKISADIKFRSGKNIVGAGIITTT